MRNRSIFGILGELRSFHERIHENETQLKITAKNIYDHARAINLVFARSDAENLRIFVI